MLITCFPGLIISLRVKSIRAESPSSPFLNIWPHRGRHQWPMVGAWSNYTCVAARVHLLCCHAYRSSNPSPLSMTLTLRLRERTSPPRTQIQLRCSQSRPSLPQFWYANSSRTSDVLCLINSTILVHVNQWSLPLETRTAVALNYGQNNEDCG